MPRSLPAVSKHVVEWDEGDVQQWFTSLGYPQYDRLLREHKIGGDALCMIDPGGLQALGVSSAGQRLSILRAIYNLKMEQGIPLDEDSYIPPSESNDVQQSPPIEELRVTVKDQGRRLVTLEEENRALATAMQTFSQEIEKLRSSLKVAVCASTINVYPESPETFIQNEPAAPPQHTRSKSHDLARSTLTKNYLEVPERSQTPVLDLASASALVTPSSSASDLGYGSKVSLNDPTWKVLPAALKRHGNEDDPKEYVMFISYGPQGNRTKRRLELEEKPLYLFKKLKEAKKNPAFLLKKIKDVRYQYGADLSNGTASQETWTPDTSLSNILPTPPSSIRGVTPEPI